MMTDLRNIHGSSDDGHPPYTTIKGYRYSKEDLDITVEEGKKTLQYLCRPVFNGTNGYKQYLESLPALSEAELEKPEGKIEINLNDSGVSLEDDGSADNVLLSQLERDRSHLLKQTLSLNERSDLPEVHGQSKERKNLPTIKIQKPSNFHKRYQKKLSMVSSNGVSAVPSESGSTVSKNGDTSRDELQARSPDLEGALRANKHLQAELESALSARNWYQEQMLGSRRKCTELISDLMRSKEVALTWRTEAQSHNLTLNQTQEVLREERGKFVREKEKMIFRYESLQSTLSLPPNGEAELPHPLSDVHSQLEIHALSQKLVLKESMLENQSRRIHQLDQEISMLKHLCESTTAAAESTTAAAESTTAAAESTKSAAESSPRKFSSVEVQTTFTDTTNISKCQINGQSFSASLRSVHQENLTGIEDVTGNRVENTKSIQTEDVCSPNHNQALLDSEVKAKINVLNDVNNKISEKNAELKQLELDFDQKTVAARTDQAITELRKLESEIKKKTSIMNATDDKIAQNCKELKTVQSDLSVQLKELVRTDAEIDGKYNKLYTMDSELDDKATKLKLVKEELMRKSKEAIKLHAEHTDKGNKLNLEIEQKSVEFQNLGANLKENYLILENLHKEIEEKCQALEGLNSEIMERRIELCAVDLKLENLQINESGFNSLTSSLEPNGHIIEPVLPGVSTEDQGASENLMLKNMEQRTKISELERTLMESINFMADLNSENDKLKNQILEPNCQNRTTEEQNIQSREELQTLKDKLKEHLKEIEELNKKITQEKQLKEQLMVNIKVNENLTIELESLRNQARILKDSGLENNQLKERIHQLEERFMQQEQEDGHQRDQIQEYKKISIENMTQKEQLREQEAMIKDQEDKINELGKRRKVPEEMFNKQKERIEKLERIIKEQEERTKHEQQEWVLKSSQLKLKLNEISLAKDRLESEYGELAENFDQAKTENKLFQEEKEGLRVKYLSLLDHCESEKMELENAIRQLNIVHHDMSAELVVIEKDRVQQRSMCSQNGLQPSFNVSDLKAFLKQVSEENCNLKRDLNRISQEKENFSKQCDKISKENIELIDHIERFGKEKLDFNKEMELLSLDKFNLNQEVDKISTEKLNLRKEVEKISEEKQDNFQVMDKLTTENHDLGKEILKISTKLENISAKNLHLTNDLAEGISRRTSMLEELKVETQSKDQLRGALQKMDEEVKTLGSKLEERGEEVLALRSKLDEMKEVQMQESLEIQEHKKLHSSMLRENEKLYGELEDITELRQSLEHDLVRLRDDMIAERHDKNLIIRGLDQTNRSLVAQLASLQTQLSEVSDLRQERMMLEDRLDQVRLEAVEREGRIGELRGELEQLRHYNSQLQQCNITKISGLEQRLQELETEKTQLQREKSDNAFQIKQLNRALRTSLTHIRSLRTMLEDLSPEPGLELSSALYLLDGPGPPEHTPVSRAPRLRDLQLCLESLRSEVRDLNCELSSRSTTPTVSRALSRPGSLSPFNLSTDLAMETTSPSLPTSPAVSPLHFLVLAPPSASSSLPGSGAVSFSSSPQHSHHSR